MPFISLVYLSINFLFQAWLTSKPQLSKTTMRQFETEEFLKTNTFLLILQRGDWDLKAPFEFKGLLEASNAKLVTCLQPNVLVATKVLKKKLPF